MVDFIEEVEEQLRSDRYRALARRFGPWFIGLVILVVAVWLGVWGYQTWQDRNVDKASVAYDKAVAAMAQGDETGAYTTLEPIAKDGPPAYKALALMQQGNIRMAADKSEEGAALFDKAAAAAPNVVLGDLARLKAALALLDTAPYPQLQTRLAALIGDKKPYDLFAREALATAKLNVGKTAEARGDFSALLLTLGVTDGMKQRAQSAIAVIDSGQAKSLPDVVKVAATLPPPAQPSMSPDGSPQGPDNAQAGGAPQPAPDPRNPQ